MVHAGGPVHGSAGFQAIATGKYTAAGSRGGFLFSNNTAVDSNDQAAWLGNDSA